MNTVLWIIQGILGGMFILAGVVKSTRPIDKLGEKMPWVKEMPHWVRIIGVLELLGGIGIILPWLTGIVPILTPLAAVGLALTMIGAAVYHFSHKEMKEIGFNMALLLMAAFVAYGRF